MSDRQDAFERLVTCAQETGVAGLLDSLADRFLAEKRYHELFEVRKMQVRRQIGLPALYSDSGDELPEEQRSRLETGLLDACREIGLLLLKQGKLREGWMYFRPVGDRAAVRAAIGDIEFDDDNLDEAIEVLLHEGVDVPRGYALVLQHYGTCNAITTYESALPHHGRADQQAAAALLVEHIHRELTASVVADIGRNEGATPADAPLASLVADRDWMFTEYSYHVDTTHLASTVRIARLLDDERPLRLALDLTHYGRRLASQFQYQGDEPFADIYPSHALFFQALLGENVDDALAFFRDKAVNVDRDQFGTIAIEVFVDLLHRIGRSEDALREMIDLMPEGARPRGLCPSLYELSRSIDKYDLLREYCRQRDDMLGFATALVCEQDR